MPELDGRTVLPTGAAGAGASACRCYPEKFAASPIPRKPLKPWWVRQGLNL